MRKGMLFGRYVIVNPVRFACFLSMLAVLIIGFATLSFPREARAQEEFIPYVVRAGDTLWDIAGEQVGQSMDKREYIYRIQKINQHPGTLLAVGEVLLLPPVN